MPEEDNKWRPLEERRKRVREFIDLRNSAEGNDPNDAWKYECLALKEIILGAQQEDFFVKLPDILEIMKKELDCVLNF